MSGINYKMPKHKITYGDQSLRLDLVLCLHFSQQNYAAKFKIEWKQPQSGIIWTRTINHI